jgi:2-(1,2-epoxy-1,2-dihydrophenyl)acetyl-CoA isomerase
MSDEDPAPLVMVERKAAVSILKLNRPHKLNALNYALMTALHAAVADAANDDTVHCVILTGAGRGFCSGGDLNNRRQNPSSDKPRTMAEFEENFDRLRAFVEAARLLHEMPKPTIAMINGPCAGGGFSLAGACDLRVAGSSAVITSAFTRVGLTGDYGGTWFWTHILGTAKTRRLFLLNEKFDGTAALSFGLVDFLHDDGLLEQETLAMADALAALPRATVRYAKVNLNSALTSCLNEALSYEVTHTGLARAALAAAAKRNAAPDRPSGE